MTTRTELRIPVGGGHEVAVTVVSPEIADGTVVFAFPGGGYGRRYYDLDLPGAYSQAAWHAAHGWTVVCCDHLGVGDSSLPDPQSLTFELLAAANAEMVSSVVGALHLAGPVIGIGQSMGGCLLVLQQAYHRSFDGIGVLGFSAVHTLLPMPDGGFPMSAGISLEEGSELLTRAITSYGFHFSDVPRAIVDQDLDGYPLRLDGNVPVWASRDVPPVAVTMLAPGIIAQEAASIEVPVLVVAGEIDVNMDLDAEQIAYPRSLSVETWRMEQAAHMHNFASSREQLWAHIQTWGTGITRRV